LLEKVDPVDELPTGVGGGEDLPSPGLKRSEHVARVFAPAIINLLLRSACWFGFRRFGIHELLAWIALDGHRTHLVQAHRHTACWRSGVDGLNGPPFFGEVGIDPLAKPRFFVSPPEAFGGADLADAAAYHADPLDAVQVLNQPIQRPARIVLSQILGIREARLHHTAHSLS